MEDSDVEKLNAVDAMDDSTDIIVDSDRVDYESTLPIEFVKSTRKNFMTWKDYDY